MVDVGGLGSGGQCYEAYQLCRRAVERLCSQFSRRQAGVRVGRYRGGGKQNSWEDNPAVPGGDNPSYNPSNNTTSYTTVAHSGSTTTTTTEVSGGDNRSGYVAPQGVTSTTTTNIGEGTPLATGLVITSTVAAASGIAFFIIAKRRKDDEDEEEEEEID